MHPTFPIPSAADQTREALRIVDEVGIPPQPTVLMEINRIAARADVDFDQIADIVRKDVALSARILSLAGSPMFLGGTRFDCVTDALMVLGFHFFKRCVLMASVEEAMSGFDFDMKKFWFHSSVAAGLCQKLSERYFPHLSEQAYTLGLFHDVGTVILGKYRPTYRRVADQALGLDFEAASREFECVGCDHGTVGRIFSQKWALSQAISEVIQYHHDPEYSIHKDEDTRLLKAILQLAERLFEFAMKRETTAIAPNKHSQRAMECILQTLCLSDRDIEDLKGLVEKVVATRF